MWRFSLDYVFKIKCSKIYKCFFLFLVFRFYTFQYQFKDFFFIIVIRLLFSLFIFVRKCFFVVSNIIIIIIFFLLYILLFQILLHIFKYLFNFISQVFFLDIRSHCSCNLLISKILCLNNVIVNLELSIIIFSL